MAEFAQPQQNPYEDRITSILQKRAQPYSPDQYGLAGEAAVLRAQAGGEGNVQKILEATLGAQDQRELESTKGLYDIFEQKRSQGDAQSKALFDRISMFTGGDPDGTAMFLNELHNDPEVIDPSNAYQIMTKLAGIAKKTGYTSLDSQVKRAQIASANALANQRQTGGGGSSVFAQTMAAIDADPNLKQLPTIDKIRMAQNRLGTNLTIGSDGTVDAMTGAAESMGQIKKSEGFGRKVGELQGASFANLPKTEASLRSAEQKNTLVTSKIDQIIPRVSGLTAGFGGTALSKIPGSDARDLQRDIDTVLANIGFNELQEMRNNSPTGGALGSIAVQELNLLQSVKANLQQDQSPEQLVRNLQEAKLTIQQSNQRIREAYERDRQILGDAAQQNIGDQLPPQVPSEDPIEAELRRRGAL
jgi:hypothetical protein